MTLGSILCPVNSSIVAVSLIPIGIAFGAPPWQTAWLVSAFYLATAIGQPIAGRLVDTYGPRQLFLTGAGLTGLAGILGVAAPNLWVLVSARVILGFGTCAGYPAAMYLVRRESRRLGEYSPLGVLTTLAIASQTFAAVGPTVGGLLIGLGGWRATFAVNIPLGVASFALGARGLPGKRAGEDAERATASLDLAGIAAFALMLLSLLLVMLVSRAPARLGLVGIAAMAVAVFVVREQRAAEPFIDLRLVLRNRPLLTTYLRTFLFQLVGYSFMYGYPQWLEYGRGLSATASGLVLLPLFATAIFVSVATGRRSAIRCKLVAASVIQTVACVLLRALTGADASVLVLVGLAVLIGVPQGLNNLANQNALYLQADEQSIASAAGLSRTFGYLGAIGSSAVTGALFGPAAGTVQLHELALFMIAASVLLVLVTLLDRSLGVFSDMESSSNVVPVLSETAQKPTSGDRIAN
jgi:MFS family permease